jgi:hypothetical protein
MVLDEPPGRSTRFLRPHAPPVGCTGRGLHLRLLQKRKDEEMRATKLRELGEMAAKLLETARKLPPGPERSNLLREIGGFRSQIIALQEASSRPARRGESEMETE